MVCLDDADCLFIHHLLSMSIHVHVMSIFNRSCLHAHSGSIRVLCFEILCLTKVETRLLKESKLSLGPFLCREI